MRVPDLISGDGVGGRGGLGLPEMCAARRIFSNQRAIQNKKGGKCIAGTPGNAFTAERRPPISPIWPDLNSCASTCAWSVILELSERPRQGEGFPSPLWFIQYLANLALNLPHEISIHSGPPLPRHTWTTCLLDLVPSHAPLRCTFATTTTPLPPPPPSQNEKQAQAAGLGFALHPPYHPPTHHSAGHLLITMCGPIAERAGGHLWFARIETQVLWGWSGSQRAAALPAFIATLTRVSVSAGFCSLARGISSLGGFFAIVSSTDATSVLRSLPPLCC